MVTASAAARSCAFPAWCPDSATCTMSSSAPRHAASAAPTSASSRDFAYASRPGDRDQPTALSASAEHGRHLGLADRPSATSAPAVAVPGCTPRARRLRPAGRLSRRRGPGCGRTPATATGPGVDPELLAQPVPQLREELQGLPLALQPVRRSHGEHHRPLVERVLGHQPDGDAHRLRDVARERRPGAGRQQRCGQVPPGPPLQLLQAHPLGHHQVVAHPAVRRPPGPQRQRLPAAPHRAVAGRPRPSQGREALRVETHVDRHDVPRVGRAHQVVAELAAQPRHDRVHGGGRERGRGVVPHQVEHDLRGTGRPRRVTSTASTSRCSLAPRGGGRLDPVPHPDRAEDSHLHVDHATTARSASPPAISREELVDGSRCPSSRSRAAAPRACAATPPSGCWSARRTPTRVSMPADRASTATAAISALPTPRPCQASPTSSATLDLVVDAVTEPRPARQPYRSTVQLGHEDAVPSRLDGRQTGRHPRRQRSSRCRSAGTSTSATGRRRRAGPSRCRRPRAARRVGCRRWWLWT